MKNISFSLNHIITKTVVVTICCFTAYFATAQSKCDCFDRLRNLSVYYDNNGNEPMAISAMKDALSYLDDSAIFNIGEYYAELGEDYMAEKNYDSAVAYYMKAVEWGGENKASLKEKPELYSHLDTNLLNKYDEIQRRKIDFALYDQFAEVKAIDQSVRNGIFFPISGVKNKPACWEQIEDTLSLEADAHDFKFVRSFIETYGRLPSPYKLGFNPSFFVYLLHITANDNENSKYLFELLNTMNESCTFPCKSLLIFMIDRQQYGKSRKTFCGTFGPDRFRTIEDVSKADSIRFRYNLLRIKEDATPAEIPPGYKPSAYPSNYFCLKKYGLQ